MRYPLSISVAAVLLSSILSSAPAKAVELDADGMTSALIELPVLGGGDNLPQMAMSPDGRAVAFSLLTTSVNKNESRLEWYIQELEGERNLLFVGDGGVPMMNIRQRTLTNGSSFGTTVRWSPDGRWIAYPKQVGDEIQLWRSRRDGSVQEKVTSNEANIFGSNRYEALFHWSGDGSKIYYEVARSREEMAQKMSDEGDRGYLFDGRFIASDASRPLWMRCETSRQGEVPIASQACQPTLWTVDLRSKTERPANSHEMEEYRRMLDQVDDGLATALLNEKRLTDHSSPRQLWLRNIDPEKFQGYRPPLRLVAGLEDGNEIHCALPECVSTSIAGAWWIGDQVAFQKRGETSQQSHMLFFIWNPKEGSVRLLLETNNILEACQGSGSELICFEEGATRPRRLVSIEAETGRVTSLFDPAARKSPLLVDYIDSIKMEYLSWEADDGAVGRGILLYPKDYAPGSSYPLVLVQHGVGRFKMARIDEAPTYELVNTGFFVLNTSPFEDVEAYSRYRGARLAEAEFEDYNRRRRALSAYEQIVTRLGERGLVDVTRVAITGLSSGSTNAKYAMVNSNIFSTASLSTGYSGPQQYWFAPPALRENLRNAFPAYRKPYSQEAQNRTRKEQLGYFAMDRVFPPILHQIADSEFSHALFDHVLLADEGHPVEMYVFPDELHVKWQPIHRYHVYRRNLDWLRFWLQGVLSTSPVDVTQYDRWRVLCRRYLDNLRASSDPEDGVRIKDQRCALQL